MKPNIMFLTIDSLRADKCYGTNKTSKTPNIDFLINNGVYFSQDISSADQTGTSLASIFTGLYATKSGITHFNFTSNTPTHFDIFKKNGYQTYGFVPDDSFFINLTSSFTDRTVYTKKGKSWLRLGEGLGEQIVEWMKSKKMKEPWIFYIHLMDIKAPSFFVPDEFDKEDYGDTKYDRVLSSLDIWVGKILKEIEFKNTLFVLSSDHGEYIPVTGENITEIPKIQSVMRKVMKAAPFTERLGLKSLIFLRSVAQTYRKEKLRRTLTSYEMRSFNTRGAIDLYDELVRVPLIFTGYNINTKKIIPDLVRQVDIFPTIREIIGLSDQQVNRDGRSLVPLIRGEKMEEIPAYLETGINLSQLLDTKNPKIFGRVIGLRTSKHKYLRSREDPNLNVRLYDLKNDPLEQNNIAEIKTDTVKKMEMMLAEIIKDSKSDQLGEMSDEELKKTTDELRKLGYI